MFQYTIIAITMFAGVYQIYSWCFDLGEYVAKKMRGNKYFDNALDEVEFYTSRRILFGIAFCLIYNIIFYLAFHL